MHAVYPLIAGIQGAQAGTARIYARGTTVRAPYWLDFEATQQVANTADIVLDSNGGAEVYVGQLVDVTVFDSSGNEVRSFVAGSEAPNVEVRSQSFTGTDYITGAQAAANPTTLQAVLDRALTSFGTTDWKVLIGASPTLLATALANVTGLVFNVKSPTYGAAGNGTTDDSAAIQAAITAAALTGGVVAFPPGTYRCTAELTMATNVSLVGAGSAASILKLDHATNSLLVWATAAQGQRSVVSGLGFSLAQANNGRMIELTVNNAAAVVRECAFSVGGTAFVGRAISVDGGLTGTALHMTDCDIQVASGSRALVVGSGSLHASRCRTTWVAGAYNDQAWASSGGMVLVDCLFDATNVSSGSFFSVSAVSVVEGEPNALVGCSFSAPGGGTHQVSVANGLVVATRAPSSVVFIETNLAASSTYAQAASSDRERVYRRVALAATTYTLADDTGVTVITYSAVADLTLTMPTFVLGKRMRLYFHNDTGSIKAVTFVLGADTSSLTPNAAVNTNGNSYTQIDFEMVYINSLACLRYVVTDASRSEPV